MTVVGGGVPSCCGAESGKQLVSAVAAVARSADESYDSGTTRPRFLNFLREAAAVVSGVVVFHHLVASLNCVIRSHRVWGTEPTKQATFQIQNCGVYSTRRFISAKDRAPTFLPILMIGIGRIDGERAKVAFVGECSIASLASY